MKLKIGLGVLATVLVAIAVIYIITAPRCLIRMADMQKQREDLLTMLRVGP